MDILSKNELIRTHERIKPFIHNTPVLTSSTFNKFTNAELFFKCENFQRMGAFKMRGALNAILNLSDEQKKNGVVTHSSGNFAQALALGAREAGVKAYIVMPSNAPQVKKNAVIGYGGIITECEPTVQARETTAKEIEDRTGATFIHSYNNYDVILGQGTAAKELIEKENNLDYIFSPVGGGGLISGTSLASHYFSKSTKVIGCEPKNVDDAYRSLKAGHIIVNKTTDTIADGLKTNLGDKTFPVIQNFVNEIIRVSESEIINSMQLIWERMKIIIEPSSAVVFAALVNKKDNFRNKKIGLIISGGNVDLKRLPF